MSDRREGWRTEGDGNEPSEEIEVARKCSRRNVMVFDRSVSNGLVNDTVRLWLVF
jgi:hypothetical protein